MDFRYLRCSRHGAYVVLAVFLSHIAKFGKFKIVESAGDHALNLIKRDLSC
jgi:hypothetical protein